MLTATRWETDSPRTGSDPLSRPRVFLIGEPESRPEGLERALVRSGFQVVEADPASITLPSAEFPEAILLSIRKGGEVLKEWLAALDPSVGRDIPLVVTIEAPDPDAVVRALALGVADAMALPLSLGELCARIGLRIHAGHDALNRGRSSDASQRLFEAFQDICGALRPEEALETLVQKLSGILQVRHCSCVLIAPDGRRGRTVSVAEDPLARDLIVDLAKYPEIIEAMQSRRTIYVPDLQRSPLFEATRERWRNAHLEVGVQSVAAIPLTTLDKVIGVVLLRTRAGDPILSQEQVDLAESLIRGTSRILESEERRSAIYRRQVSFGLADELTGCGSLDALDQRLSSEFERARRYNLTFSLVLLDVDQLRDINAQFGQEAGDQLLADLGIILQREIRSPDFVARYSGDEFALVLPETDSAGARRTIERIRSRVTSHSFNLLSPDFDPGLSAGIVTYPHPTALSTEDLLALAEAGLVVAKGQSSGRIAVAAPMAA